MEFKHPLDTGQTLKYIIEQMDKDGIILLGFIVMAKVNNAVCPSIFTYVEDAIDPEILISKLKESCEQALRVYALRKTIEGNGGKH